MESERVHSLFERQYGVAAAAQLVALGVSARTVRRTRQQGTWRMVLPGVYQRAGTTLSFAGRAMAVLLHFGPTSFLSGPTAAALLGFRAMPVERITVTVPEVHRVGVMPAWVRVRRTAWIDADDVMTRPDGLRLSCPLRTMFTLAAEFNDFRFQRAAEDAWHLGLVSPAAASEYLRRVRRSGRGGVARFEAWLDRVATRARPSQSGLELDVIDEIRRVGLPDPDRQHPLRLLNGELIHIDVAWPALKLGVEPGHSWWHGGDLQARRDAARDRACGELGWQIVRLDESLKNDLRAVGEQIRRIHDARRFPPNAG